MKTMLLGIYLAVMAVFCLLLCVHEVLPAWAIWASFLLALLSVSWFMNGYTEKGTPENEKENQQRRE